MPKEHANPFLETGPFEAVPAAVKALLVDAARARKALTYSELLGMLGYRFTRPKMRALLRVVGEVEEDARRNGEPDLAVLLVRESDGLPGQGWWTTESVRAEYDGEDKGPDAANFVRGRQKLAFDYWAEQGG